MKLLLVFVIGCIALSAADTLTCYDCTSIPNVQINKQCENAASKYETICPTSAASCSKYLSNDGILTRGCSVEREKNGCEKVGDGTVCYCNKDKCNSSNIVSSSVAALLAIFWGIILNC